MRVLIVLICLCPLCSCENTPPAVPLNNSQTYISPTSRPAREQIVSDIIVRSAKAYHDAGRSIPFFPSIMSMDPELDVPIELALLITSHDQAFRHAVSESRSEFVKSDERRLADAVYLLMGSKRRPYEILPGPVSADGWVTISKTPR